MEIFVWPLVVVILGIVVLILFRKQISDLIGRTEKIGKIGLEARTQSPQNLKDGNKASFSEKLKAFDNRLLLEVEEFIKSDLESIQTAQAEEREKYLIRKIADILISNFFEKTYYYIYGSQINVLEFLNNLTGNMIEKEKLRSFYENGKQKTPLFYQGYQFDGWMDFLLLSVLVKEEGGKVGITLRGKEFLKFLIDRGYIFLKQG